MRPWVSGHVRRSALRPWIRAVAGCACVRHAAVGGGPRCRCAGARSHFALALSRMARLVVCRPGPLRNTCRRSERNASPRWVAPARTSRVSTRRIFLARHGNRQDMVDPGWAASAEEPLDPPLAADGVEQARRLGQRLAGEGIVAIVASPYLRAVQTAHHVNETLGVPMGIEPGFAEWI